MDGGSLVKHCRLREIREEYGTKFQRKLHLDDNLVSRIGLEVTLEGHGGCVNCLEWNERGDLLASGSDDQQVILWDPFAHRQLHTIQTGHHGNIFSVKFLPSSNDEVVVSGAADCKIRVHNVRSKETTHACSCHTGRVKRLATIQNVPAMFWSAAEDGMVMQFDLRTPHTCATATNNVLVSLSNHMGKYAEAKCVAINPLRPEQLAVGANDPYVRLYDRRMISPVSVQQSQTHLPRCSWDRFNCTCGSVDDPSAATAFTDNLGAACTQYFVAGHLPLKTSDSKKRHRALASTYLTFGPNGNELLVNLGGEQIYLFDINRPRKPKTVNLNFPSFAASLDHAPDASKDYPNGFGSGHRNGTGGSSTSSMTVDSKSSSPRKSLSRPLCSKAESWKQRANVVFEKQQYSTAINMYNRALQLSPHSAVLYGNRAAAYMKRGWDGDLYAALRDCLCALRLEPEHLKAHFRLARCLLELQLSRQAHDCLQLFKTRFPEHARTNACLALERDMKNANASRTQQDDLVDEEMTVGGSEEAGGGRGDGSGGGGNRLRHKTQISVLERSWRSAASDYEKRFCGHCNTTTDIKEANYFGSDGQYVVAGSDDGSFFIWDTITTNIVRILKGDDSIVNCLQPHPTFAMLATSGIDPVVRLWSPRPQDGRRDDREVTDSDDAALANQKRMNADPLEVMLLNMGYRIRSVLEGDDDVELPEPPEVQCRPS